MAVSVDHRETIDGVERCANTPRPLAHLIDLTDRQDEMNVTTAAALRECHLCHRTGERLFKVAPDGLWRCSMPHTCAKRRGDRPEEPNESAFERLFAALRPEGNCLVFDGSRSEHGYGRLSVRGRQMKAHRLAWIIQNGPIPDGLHVLHTCDNPPCCNPEHLFLGTHQDNMTDASVKGRFMPDKNVQSKKTHCPNGHAYSGGNLLAAHGKRYCRTCRRDNDTKRRRARIAARQETA